MAARFAARDDQYVDARAHLCQRMVARPDQRVPAFWISEGRPKLGWCWDRNPHTWLGTASCATRLPEAR